VSVHIISTSIIVYRAAAGPFIDVTHALQSASGDASGVPASLAEPDLDACHVALADAIAAFPATTVRCGMMCVRAPDHTVYLAAYCGGAVTERRRCEHNGAAAGAQIARASRL
jgi:hypothetical protein